MAKNNSFMYGAAILLMANLMVKVIGAVFKIPLTYILGETGMGLFSTSYTIYTWLFVIATAGFPVAISKMIAESTALGRGGETNKIFKISLIVLGIIGVLGTAILFFFADAFSMLTTNTLMASPGIRAIAPAVFGVAIMSVFRGYFQGRQNMFPTALSEVVESFGKLLIGFAAAYLLVKKGVEYASSGAVFGVSMGAIIAMIMLMAVYITGKKKEKAEKGGEVSSAKTILRRLIVIALPITIGASVFTLTSVIDLAMIMRRLAVAGIGEKDAIALYGLYSGYAIPIFNMPSTLVSSISVSIVPAIAAAYACKNIDETQKIINGGLKITTLFALPCAIGIALLSNPILNLLYNNARATSMLSILGYAVVFVSLVLVTNAILQAIGKVWVPVINMAAGGVLKIIINFFLVGNPSININGAPIGTTACYILILFLNLIVIAKTMGIKYDASSLLVKPLLSVAVMAVTVLVCYNIFGDMGRILSAAIPIFGGMVSYFAMILITKPLSDDEILMLPKGEKIIKILKRK